MNIYSKNHERTLEIGNELQKYKGITLFLCVQLVILGMESILEPKRIVWNHLFFCCCNNKLAS